MNYSLAIEKLDLRRIDKLNNLKDLETFWNDVRKLTKRISSDHSLRHWQALAEVREKELKRINELKDKVFMLQMKDFWDENDRNEYDDMIKEIKKLGGKCDAFGVQII